MIATHELVVPKSIPMTSPASVLFAERVRRPSVDDKAACLFGRSMLRQDLNINDMMIYRVLYYVVGEVQKGGIIILVHVDKKVLSSPKD